MLRTLAVPLLLFVSAIAYAQVPLVISIAPESGPVGTPVTITGVNFGSDPATTSVYFGAVKAVITELTPTQIKTNVPVGASYKQVSVLSRGLLALSPKPFVVTSVNETLIQANSFSEGISFEVGGSPYEVAATDLDGDGKTDIIVAGFKVISVLRNTSVQGRFTSTSFASPVNVTTSGIAAASIATGDIDGDGKQDIVAISSAGNANTVSVFRNNSQPGAIAASSFTEYAFSTGPNPQKIALADLDNDGKLDLITANANNSISILRNMSTTGLAFGTRVDINSTAGTAETVVAADMDLDGKTDIVEYNFSNNAYTISVLRNQVVGDIRINSFALGVNFGTGLISDSDIAIGDLDNDGKPDMLANFGSSNTISILKNLSTPGNFNPASFGTKVDFGTGTNPFCGKAIADINGDGFPEIISTNRESNTWSVLQNKAQAGVINTASFLPKVDFATGQKPTGVATADFDGDGMTDVVVVSRESKTAAIYRNQMADPMIASFTPLGGTAGGRITLTGVNFGNDPSAISVKIHGKDATVETTTPTTVTAIVPQTATTGAVSITKKGATYTTTREYTVLLLSISGFSPATAYVGAQIVIKGKGFSSKTGNNVVKIGSIEAPVVSQSSNELTITVPQGATTGKISINTNGVNTVTTSTDLVISTVAITSVTFPDLYVVNNGQPQASLSYNNAANISKIRFFGRGISEPLSALREREIVIAPSGQVTFDVPLEIFDRIGAQMKFVITDLAGNQISTEGYAWNRFVDENASQNIPGLLFGKTADNYQIISIPLELDNNLASHVFRYLGGFNDSKWRAYWFNGQYTFELKNESDIILPGVGYWFIAKKDTQIHPGDGTTVRASDIHPFEMKLKPGWNLIGNPYNFTLSWDDVLSYNGNPEAIGTLRQFEGGTFAINNKLNRFRGAFVRNQSSQEVVVKIPVANTQGNGRKRSDEVDPRNWEIIFTLSDGRISNSLGGFGMNTNASENIDRWDEVALPTPTAMSSFELVMREDKEQIVKDIVPASGSYTWTGTVKSSDGVTLSWTNELNKELWMELPGNPSLIDMRSANKITLPAGATSFRVFYGNIPERNEMIVGDVATNPLTQNQILLPVNFNSETSIAMNILNTKGSYTPHKFYKDYPPGRHVIEWHDGFLQLSPGLYILAITINSSQTIYRKFNIE